MKIFKAPSKRLAFIQPKIDDGNLTPPLGPLIMASIMEREGWEVGMFDERVDDGALRKAMDFKPGVVGISAVTASVLRGKAIAESVKEASPDTVVVFGGPHPTAMPDEVAGWNAVDFVVEGEGENAIKSLCRWLTESGSESQLSSIENLAYKNGAGVTRNPRCDFMPADQLDSLPMPAFHLLDLDRIFGKTVHGLYSRGSRILPVMSSRGCPSPCTYCCRMMGFSIRYRSVNSLLDEMDFLISRYALDEIWFEDDNFTASRRRAHEMLDAIIARNYGINMKFANGLRADGVDAALLEKLKRAGCYSLSFGIETGSPKVLELMRKKMSLEKAGENVKLAKSMGFLVGANCIIGYPGETMDDIKTSLDYFMELDLDSMAVVNLIPFPGTEARRVCEEKGYLTPLANDWNNYVFDIKSPRVLIETELLSAVDVTKMINLAYRRMYLDPRRMFRIARNMKPRELLLGVKTMLSKIF